MPARRVEFREQDLSALAIPSKLPADYLLHILLPRLTLRNEPKNSAASGVVWYTVCCVNNRREAQETRWQVPDIIRSREKGHHMKTTVLIAVVVLAGFAGVAWGQSRPAPLPGLPYVIVDENGNGSLHTATGTQTLPYSIGLDPGPGGLSNALIYTLPGNFNIVAGDLLLDEVSGGVGNPSDLVRFNNNQAGTSQLVFYSDTEDGADALADTGLPGEPYDVPAMIEVQEWGTEALNGYVYQPQSRLQGYTSVYPTLTFYIISDGSASVPVPEPATMTLLVLGLGGAAILRRKMKK